MMGTRTYHANALHTAGRREDAASVFADAERRQKATIHFSIPHQAVGIATCCWPEATTPPRATGPQRHRNRTPQQLAARSRSDTLTLGRAHFGLTLATIGAQQPAVAARNDAPIAHARIDDAIDALRVSGQSDELPRGLLARAAFGRSVGDWEARSAISTRSRRSLSWGRCDYISATWHSTRAARVRAQRGVRAAQWAHRRQPAEAGAGGRGGAQEPARRSGKAARHRGRLHRDVRLPPARRGARRAASRPARRAHLRLPATPGVTAHARSALAFGVRPGLRLIESRVVAES